LKLNESIHRLKFYLKPNNRGIDSSLFQDYNNHRLWPDRGLICHAPFKSLRFEQNGNLKVCCFNSAVTLGTYPENSLKESWFGKEANKLRKAIAKNDFSLGCQLCGEQLKNRELDTIKTKQFDELPNDGAGFPLILDFSLHNLCNLECSMCTGQFSSLIRKNREGLPPIKMRFDAAFVTQLEPFIQKAERFIFAGGEPFLIELYYDILDRIAQLKPDAEVHVVTNGTVLNNRVRRLLEKLRFHITISIDSFEEEAYESIRKNASFSRTIEHISFFEDYCKTKKTQFNFNICPIKENWKEIPEMVRDCNEKGRKLTLLTVVYPPTSSLMSCSSEELAEISSFYSKIEWKGSEDGVAAHNISQFGDLKKKVDGWAKRASDPSSARKDSGDGKKTIEVAFYVDRTRQILEEFFKENPEIDTSLFNFVRENLKAVEIEFNGKLIKEAKLMELNTAEPGQLFRGFSNQDQQQVIGMFRDHVL